MVSPYAIANIRSEVNEQSFTTEHFPPVRPALPPPSVSEAPRAKTEIPKPEPTTPGILLFICNRLLFKLSSWIHSTKHTNFITKQSFNSTTHIDTRSFVTARIVKPTWFWPSGRDYDSSRRRKPASRPRKYRWRHIWWSGSNSLGCSCEGTEQPHDTVRSYFFFISILYFYDRTNILLQQ